MGIGAALAGGLLVGGGAAAAGATAGTALAAGSLAASTIGSMAGAKEQSESIEKAADTTAQAQAYAADVQRDMLERQLEVQKPFREAGYDVLPTLKTLALDPLSSPYAEEKLGISSDLRELTRQGPDTGFEPSPIYDWRLQEGTEAINQNLAAQGLLGSRYATDTLSDLSTQLTAEETEKQYGRGVAEYNRQYGSLLDLYNMLNQEQSTNLRNLTNLANIGQGMAAQGGQAMQQTGQGLAGTAMAGGTNLANLAMQQGNIQGNMLANVGAMPLQALNTYQMQNTLRKRGRSPGMWGGGGGTTMSPYWSGDYNPSFSLQP